MIALPFPPRNVASFGAVFTVAVAVCMGAGCALRSGTHAELPRPETFDPERFSGVWYEWARLPVFYQKNNTLAVAAYAPGDRPGRVSVYNREVLLDGNVRGSVRGVADLADGNPPGRLTVRFPGIPGVIAAFTGPNYHVLNVDPEYRVAIVGQPSRKALWILGRRIPAPDDELKRAMAFARDAGFDVESLLIAPWGEVLRNAPNFHVSMETTRTAATP